MLRIAVVEDQTETRECLCSFIRQYAEEHKLQIELQSLEDGAEIVSLKTWITMI